MGAGHSVERVTGIEPAWPAWKAGALPLSYTRETVGGTRWAAARSAAGQDQRKVPVRHESSAAAFDSSQGYERAVGHAEPRRRVVVPRAHVDAGPRPDRSHARQGR